jgi:hypothetical protein
MLNDFCGDFESGSRRIMMDDTNRCSPQQPKQASNDSAQAPGKEEKGPGIPLVQRPQFEKTNDPKDPTNASITTIVTKELDFEEKRNGKSRFLEHGTCV